jgi:hypothetical protein
MIEQTTDVPDVCVAYNPDWPHGLVGIMAARATEHFRVPSFVLGLDPTTNLACFLAPLSVAGSSEKSGGTVAVVAGLIAAVKLARVESIELQNRSPRLRSAISDSITLARMVLEASKAK